MTPLISIEDAESLIVMLAAAGDPTVDMPIADRKRQICEGLLRLVDGDVWVWIKGKFNPNRPDDPVPYEVLDGGWSVEERTAAITSASNPEYTKNVFGKLTAEVQAGRTHTMSRQLVMEDDPWSTSLFRNEWSRTGTDQFITSGYPLGDGGYSIISIYRRIGKPAFSNRDRLLVHLISQNVDWLHRGGSDVPAAAKVVELTIRERQVVLLLIGGDGRKQVARKLQLSEHTIGDYLKAIYRKFGVNSRSELLAHFIADR